MNDAQYVQLVEQTLTAIEDTLEGLYPDIDVEASEGVLTLSCEDSGSQVIISRQLALRELWVAARSGGFHCKWDERWYCASTDEDLAGLLSRVCSEQWNKDITIQW